MDPTCINSKHIHSSRVAYLKRTAWFLEMVVDSESDNFMFVYMLNCLFIPILAVVFLIYCGYMIAVTLCSLMERNLLRFSVLLRSWHFYNL